MQASRWADKPATPTPPTQQPAPPSAEQVQAETDIVAPAQEIVQETVKEGLPEPLPVETSTGFSTDYLVDDTYDPNVDEFAQTRGADDLFFDDDFVPVAEPVVEQTAPIEAAVEEHPVPAHQFPTNGSREGRGGHRGRGRGRGGKRGGAHAPTHEETKDEAPKESIAAETSTDANTEANGANAEDPTPKEPKTPHKEGAVRGDRSGTGGIKKAKLSEAELQERIASIKLKNSALTAAHERAEADQNEFEAREARAKQQSAERKKQQQERQKVERQNRSQMNNERERNRLRKLEAVKGREWDFEKEEGFSGTGEEKRRGAARGAHGGIAATPRTSDWASASVEEDGTATHTPSQRGRGRGRGGRGGRGRGDHSQRSSAPQSDSATQDQKPPSASDFPDLPAAASAKEDADAPKKLDFPIKGKGDLFSLPSPSAGKSWAEQVEGA